MHRNAWHFEQAAFKQALSGGIQCSKAGQEARLTIRTAARLISQDGRQVGMWCGESAEGGRGGGEGGQRHGRALGATPRMP